VGFELRRSHAARSTRLARLPRYIPAVWLVKLNFRPTISLHSFRELSIFDHLAGFTSGFPA